MKRLMFIVTAAVAILTVAPASAQTYEGPNAGVQVGPLGFGVGPMYGGGYANGALGGPSSYGYGGYTDYGSYGVPIYGYAMPLYGSVGPSGAYAAGNAYALGNDCPTTRQRIVTRNGRVIYRTRSSC